MTKTITRNGSIKHRLERHEYIDVLSGMESVLWICPVCGRQERENENGRTDTIVPGNGPTAADAILFAEMAQTESGRMKLSAILRSYPLHDRYDVDQRGVLQLATDLGIEGIGPAITLSFD